MQNLFALLALAAALFYVYKLFFKKQDGSGCASSCACDTKRDAHNTAQKNEQHSSFTTHNL